MATVRGVGLVLHLTSDYVSDVIRDTGDFYEADILDEIARRVPGGVLIDVGAHIGNHAAYFQAFVPHSTIHAFEPLPANLALLRRNTSRRSVRVHPVALSDHSGSLSMVVGDNLGHAMVGDGPIGATARTLDSYGFADVALIKVDVEGHEPAVLAGARDTIARCQPLIVIEDWRREYGPLLPGYRLAAEWETAHQTFLYEPY